MSTSRRTLLALPAALMAATPKLPGFGGTVKAFGLDWDVLDASDWSGTSDSLTLKVARPQEANPRAPIQYALLRKDSPQSFTLDVEIKPDRDPKGNISSAIIVFAWRDNLHFNYVHVSPDTGREQPVHNGIFHVYGGDRVRISDESGPRVFTKLDWTPVRIRYDGSKGLVECSVDGTPNSSLRAVDFSLKTGRIGLGSFFQTTQFRNFQLTPAS